jgi:hypothetical protein
MQALRLRVNRKNGSSPVSLSTGPQRLQPERKQPWHAILKTRDPLDVALLMNGLAVFIGAQINP